MSFLGVVTFVVLFLFGFEVFFLRLLRLIGFFTTVQEGEAKVYVLFGNVLGVISEAGLHFLWPKLG